MDLQSVDFRFHENHGGNIKLHDDQKTAEIKDAGYADGDGIVMSLEPMEFGKMYEVQLLATDDMHSLSLAMGIVTTAPTGLELPNMSYRWEHAVVLYWGSVAVHGQERKIENNEVLVQLPVNSRVGVMVDMRKHVHFYVNDHEMEVIHCEQLGDICYFMIDLCGTCSKVTTMKSLQQKGPPAKPDAFAFHCHRGKNILLSPDMKSAERRGLLHTGGGIVMSSEPMTTDYLYQVQIDKKSRDSEFWSLAVGVVLSHPCSLTTVPDRSDGWNDASFFRWDAVCVWGIEVQTDIGRDLCNLPLHAYVGVRVDNNRQLHLYVNGKDKGVLPGCTVSDPCYAMFHLCGPYQKVTALSVTNTP